MALSSFFCSSVGVTSAAFAFLPAAALIATILLSVHSWQICHAAERLGFLLPHTLHLPRQVISGSSFLVMIGVPFASLTERLLGLPGRR